MVENKFFLLFITFVWMSGLFGVLLTLAYIMQERRRHRGFMTRIGSAPRILLPLYGSLAVFCAGLGLHAYAAQNMVSLWMALAWSGLALLFTQRAISAIAAGVRDGWSVIENMPPSSTTASKNSGWKLLASGIALMLLLVNTLLAGWWIHLQLNGQSVAKSTPVVTVTTLGEAPPGQEPLPTSVMTDSGVMTDTAPIVQALVTVTPTVTTSIEAVAEVTSAATSVISSDVTSIPPSTPFVTPETMPAAEPSLTVRSFGGANVRSAPDLGAEVLTISPEGSVLPILGRTADNQWYLVRVSDDMQGWISVTVVELPGDATNIPVVEASAEAS